MLVEGDVEVKLTAAEFALTLVMLTLKGAGQPEGVNSTAPMSGVVLRGALFISRGTDDKTLAPRLLYANDTGVKSPAGTLTNKGSLEVLLASLDVAAVHAERVAYVTVVLRAAM